MADLLFNKDSTIVVFTTLKDQYGTIIPLTTPERFTVQIKSPYGNTNSSPYTIGITGSIVTYGGKSGPSQFYFTTTADHLGDYKYKVQYSSFASGSYELIGPFIKAATVGSFRVVDDDF